MIQQVLRFQVSVDHALTVHIRHGGQDLLYQIGSVLFRVRTFLDDSVKQLTTGYSGKQTKTDKELVEFSKFVIIYT